MSWRWRKSVRSGPFRISITKKGIGYSVGIPGLRYGRSPTGKKYVSQSIPGTGLYRIKYLGAKVRGRAPTALPPQTTVAAPRPTPVYVPSGPSPVAIAVGRAVSAGSRFIALTARTLAVSVARTWSTDQLGTARLRWRARGWSPPAVVPSTPPPSSPPAPTVTPSSAPAPSWLPDRNTSVQSTSPQAGSAVPPAGSSAPPTPADPWWKQKPPS